MTPRPTDSRQYATFRVADLFLGIEVLKVQELIRRQEMTHVPLAPQAVEGLINLRGQIVIAIDTRRSLGLPAAEGDDQRVNIAIRTGDSVVSLLVDEVCDVIDIPLSAYAPVPENMPLEQRQLIQCVYHVKDGLMLVLDTARVFENACS
ncbi:CheW protein [Granulicella rosea]|uniref:CheW protein n=1 Tax=Granulicella rosea TaxID=474952 RepID=A0A239CX61_9BACT|nr:chemotaxis protein CheW [Granulicella rosea]SNS23943.1 CheW protein [Granulicella rosea]